MATPELVTVRDFSTSPYAQLADNLDTPLNDILVRAEGAIQKSLGQRIKDVSYTERFRAQGPTLFLRRRPITSVTSIKRRYSRNMSWDTLLVDDFYFESDPGYIECYVDMTGYETEVVYTAGYTTLPEDLKQAILLQAVMFAYQDLEVYGSGDGKTPGITYIQDAVKNLIMPYRQGATVWH